MSDKKVCVGKITTAHGIRGAVKILAYTDDPMSLADYAPLTNESGDKIFDINIDSCNKNILIAKIPDVNDRNAALKLKDIELFVSRDKFPELEDDDEFYYSDLIGLRVVSEDENHYGTILSVEDYGAGEVIEIKRSDNGKSDMIAFTLENFPEVNISGGFVVVSPPEVDFASKDHE